MSVPVKPAPPWLPVKLALPSLHCPQLPGLSVKLAPFRLPEAGDTLNSLKLSKTEMNTLTVSNDCS